MTPEKIYVKNPMGADQYDWSMAIPERENDSDVKYIRSDVVDKMLAAEREHQINLYIAINEMMAELGLNGQIDTRHPKTDAVMNALYDIDGGEYKPEAIRRGE